MFNSISKLFFTVLRRSGIQLPILSTMVGTTSSARKEITTQILLLQLGLSIST